MWSVTSFTELRRDGIEVERWNMLHPLEEPRARLRGRVRSTSAAARSIASTDYMRAFADQIRQWVPGRYRVLGTDGFGRSDYRAGAAAVLRGRPPLRHGGRAEGARRRAATIEPGGSQEAIERYEIDAEAPMPTTV